MLLPIIFVFLIKCIAAVFSELETNLDDFDQFVRILTESKNTEVDHRKHTVQLPYTEASKILLFIEDTLVKRMNDMDTNINGIIQPNYNTFTRNFELNRDNQKVADKLQAIFQKFGQHEEVQVQFFMLLLSFAIRLGYTIGSEELAKANKGKEIPLDSFVLAYNKLLKAYPVSNDVYSFRFRYYHGVNIDTKKALIKSNKVILEFTYNPSNEISAQHTQREYNFKTLLFYAQNTFRVSRLINVLKRIDAYSHARPTIWSDEKLLFTFMDYLWTKRYANPEAWEWEMSYAIKKFGVNLATRILRQPEATAYFRKYPAAEKKLLNLQEEIKGQMSAIKEYALNKLTNKTIRDFFVQNESLMHYEDAVKIDWQTKEDLIEMVEQDVKPMFAEWKMLILESKIDLDQDLMKDWEIGQIRKDLDEQRAIFEALFATKQHFTQMERYTNGIIKLQSEMKAMKKEEERKKEQKASTSEIVEVANKNMNSNGKNHTNEEIRRKIRAALDLLSKEITELCRTELKQGYQRAKEEFNFSLKNPL